jgi:hypothetical protein
MLDRHSASSKECVRQRGAETRRDHRVKPSDIIPDCPGYFVGIRISIGMPKRRVPERFDQIGWRF